jgi:uncharacterized membrane protein YfcA
VQIPDLVNGAFEAVGGAMIVMNCVRLYRDKCVRGVSVLPVTFFTSWGIWNLFYYPSLGQWASFAGGCSIVIANAVWLGMAIHYRRN